jgi:hypothetical protein
MHLQKVILIQLSFLLKNEKGPKFLFLSEITSLGGFCYKISVFAEKTWTMQKYMTYDKQSAIDLS